MKSFTQSVANKSILNSKQSDVEQLSGAWAAVCLFVLFFSLPVCLHVSMLTGLPFCRAACISACLRFCLCLRSCGIVTKCWLHTWQAPLPACLAFWGFQALRIPSPGFLSFSLPSSSVFSPFLPFPRGWACGALSLRSSTFCESKLLTSGLCRNHRASGCKVFQIVLSYDSSSLLLFFCKQSSLSPAISSRLTVCSMRQKPHLAVI